MNNESAKPQCNKLKAAVIVVVTAITAFFAYGYEILHPTVGIDDTEIERYVLKGWEPLFNRPTLVIPGLILRFDKYVPYVYDILGMVFMIAAACLFCYIWHYISGGRIHTVSYCLFSVLFVSSPIMCETFIFYLHNGAGVAFIFVAVATYAAYRFVFKNDKKAFALATLMIVLAIGCYESFALVYAVAVMIAFLLERIYTNEKYSFKMFALEALSCVIPIISGVVCRTLVSNILPVVLKTETEGKIINAHSGSFKYWFMNNPVIILKDLIYKFIARYIISGSYFGWVIILWILGILCTMYAAYLMIKRKWIEALMLAVMSIIPWLLVIYEMEMTPYRAMHGLMMWMAAIGLLVPEFLLILCKKKRMKLTITIIIGLFITGAGFLQIRDAFIYYKLDFDTYLEDLRYTTELNTFLQANYNNLPVVFVGKYQMPEELRKRAYFLEGTKEYNNIANSFNLGKTKAFYYYCDNYGYQLYDVAHVDPLSWAAYANPSYHNAEITDFFNMHGYNISKPENPDFDEILEKSPENIWPMEDSVVEFDEYIVVRIGE